MNRVSARVSLPAPAQTSVSNSKYGGRPARNWSQLGGCIEQVVFRGLELVLSALRDSFFNQQMHGPVETLAKAKIFFMLS